MDWLYPFLVLPLFATTILALYIYQYALHNRRAPGAMQFAWLMLIVAGWAFLYTLELAGSTQSVQIVWWSARISLITFLPVAFITFAWQFTGQPARHLKRNTTLLLVPAVVFTILVWTNPLHSWVWTGVETENFGQLALLQKSYGPAFTYSLLFSITLMAVGAILLYRPLRHSSGIYRLRIPVLALGVLAPAAASLISILQPAWLLPLDYSAFSLLLVCTLIIWAILRFHFLEIMPLAQQKIIENLQDGMVILDRSDEILFANPSACRLLGQPLEKLTGMPAKAVIAEWSEFTHPEQALHAGSQTTILRRTVTREENGQSRWYDLSISLLKETIGVPVGKLVTWHDITDTLQLVENSPNPIFSVSRFGSITSWNAACQKILRYQREEILGQNYHRLIYSPTPDELDRYLSQVFLEKLTIPEIEIIYRDQDDQLKHMASRLYPVMARNGQVESCIFANTNITQRIRNEQALQRQLEELSILHLAATAAVEAGDEDELIETVTRIIGEKLYSDNCGVLLVSEKTRQILRHPSYLDRAHPAPTAVPLGIGICSRVIQLGQPVRVGDVSKEPDYFEVDPRSRSELAVPLRVGNRIIGVINAESQEYDAFSEEDERLFTTLAGQLSTAIERLRAESTVRQRIQELLAISRISQDITSVLDPQQVLNSVVRYAAQIANAGASGLFLRDSDDTLHLVATYGLEAPFIQQANSQILPVDEGTAIGLAIKSGHPVAYEDLQQLPKYNQQILAQMEGLRAALAVPMLRGMNAVGGIVIWHRNPYHFSQEEETFLQALAHQSVNAIENARLFEIEREQRQMAEVLRETGSVLSARLEIHSLMDVLLEQVERLVPYDAANFMYVEGDWARIARSRGYEKFGQDFIRRLNSLTLQISQTANLRRMVENRQPCLISDTAANPDWIIIDPEWRINSWVGAPVIVQNEVAAIISLDSMTPGFFTPEYAERLSVLAGQASLALQNARLFEETQRFARQQETLNHIIAAAVSVPDLDELMATVLELSLQAIGGDIGAIWIGDHYTLRGVQPGDSLFQHFTSHTHQSYPMTIIIRDWEQISEDDPSYAMWRLMTASGVRASLTVPLLTAGQSSGAIAICTKTKRDWQPEEVALAESIGRQIGSAAERLDLLAKTQEQAQQVQRIIDTVPEGVVLLDPSFCIQMANPAALELLPILVDGYSLEKPITNLGGRAIEDQLSAGRESAWQEVHIPTRPPQVFEIAFRNLESGQGTASRVLVLRDVTAERETLAQVQMQERLATVGQLAAGIAHDFNNIMAAVVVYADLISMQPNLSSTSREQIGIIQQQVQRATSLIRQILDFSRRSVLEPSLLDILPFLKEFDKLLERVLPENISLRLSYQPGVYMVKVDPIRLQQVMMNLALNARDAMPEGGELHILLEHILLDSETATRLPDLEPGSWIRLVIKDTGLGIEAEHLPHIFDPFFTTKPVGKGTGLGLAQVYGIIKQHGGSIDVQSEPKRGSTFTIYLPEQINSQSNQTANPAGERLTQLDQTILLVEDDQAARGALHSLLINQGLTVYPTANGLQALEVFDEVGGLIDLVVSDVVMPEMGGIPLYQAMQKKRPGVRFLFVTGHPLDAQNQESLEHGHVRWLLKPFAVQELIQTLREMLGEAA